MDNKLPIMVLAAGWSIAPILIPRVFGGAVDAPVSATAPVILNHSILSVGGNPGEADVSAFISSIPLKEHATAEETAFGLEAHVSANPQSPWAASLHNVLGMEFRREGRFTRALDHWQAAWDATKDAVDGNGKLIADETLANWVQLQASLGRFEDLTAIFDQTRGRYFEYGPHAQLYLTTLEAYRTMIWDPGQAYRCGTLALQNVAVALGQGGQLKDALFAKESPASGFALSDLVQFANDLNIGVTAVDRGNDTTIVVPSVVHWRQNHYAAIVKQRGSAYLVVDPTFGPSQWRPAEVINEEASGIFLVPRAQAPPGWRRLDLAEASRIHGRGLPTNITDTDDQRPCVSSAEQDGDCHGDCPAGTFPPGKVSLGVGPSSWGPGQSCPTCGSPGNGPLGEGNQVLPAMTGWRVSEPFESLWLEDDPIAYSPGRGPRIRLRLSYKQRDTVSLDAGVFNFGPQWNVNWLSYIEDYLSPGSDPTTNMVTLHVAGGGTSHYTVDNSTLDFLSASRMEWLTNSDGTTMAFKLHYRSGAMDIYGWLKTNVMGTNVSYASRAFLSQKIDVQGNAITFNYKASVTNTAPILVSVVDADGRSTTLNYTNTSFPNQVTSVVDPFGRTSTFSYDSSGQLQSITDPDGIVSSYTYDSNHWITNLVTPYGTTQFILTSTTNALDQATNTINRAVEVIQPDGGHHLFALRSSSDFLPDTYDDANNVPSNIPIGSLDIFCCMNYRNTFYWSPRQFANLSTTNKASFSTNDYNRAWLRHWLHDGFLIGPVLSMEREPSVASGGTNYGKMTWFDYDGKAAHGGYANQEGTTPLVGAAVKVLPDGSTWYKWFQRDQFQNITNEISTYSSVGSVATRTNSYVYDANGIDLIQVIAADGTLISSNLFTSAHLVATNFDGLGQATIFQYDASGRVTDITYPSGLETQLSYYTGSGTNLDNLGYVKQVVDVGFRTNTFGYSNGLISTHTNELSLVRNFSWDRLKRLTNVAYPDGSSMAIRYDWSDRPLDVSATKDRNGNWTYFDYTPLRQLSVVTNALSKKTEFSYCSCGSLTSVTLPLGAAIGYTYDNEGQLTSSFVSGWNVKNSYFYNAIGQRSADYVGDGVDTNIFAYTYNNQGLVTSITNTVGQIRAIAYDVLDRPTNIVDAAGTSATLTYDALGRITSAAVAGSGTNSFYYTARGLTNWVDGLGRTNWCVYDAAGRKVADTNANGEVRQFQFNPSGQITQLTDGKGNVTAWAYDVYGRLTTKTDATNNAVTYAYYPTGWLSNRVDALGQSVKYNYDAVGNLTSIAYPSRTTSFAYDAMNRLSGMSNGVGVTTWDYTGYHALLDEGGLWANDTVGYWYDTDYTREQLTIDAPNATPWLQTYLQSDLLGRKPYFTSPLGTFTYGFNGTSLLVTNLGLASGSTITNGYDAVARLTGTWFQNSAGTVLNSHTYGYDLANERSTLTNNGAQYWQYVYDAIGQLNKASGFEAGGTARLHEKLGYGYDPAGNLNVRTNNALVQTFSVNALNELTTVTNSGTLTVAGNTTSPATSVTVGGSSATRYSDNTFALAGQALASSYTAVAIDSYGRSATNTINPNLPSSVSLTYDANGNLLSDGRRSFSWDEDNQLTSVTVTNGVGNSTRSDFTYDGLGRMRIRREWKWQGSSFAQSQEVRYIYDGRTVVQERDANNIPLVTYVRWVDLSGTREGGGGIGGLLARYDHASGTAAYYHTDGNGNVTRLVNESGHAVAQYQYDPFGNLLAKAGPLADANVYRFSSKEYHATTGLYYYGFRWYDPNLQRWINRDPIGEAGGINLYQFVGNDPIDFLDPFGLEVGFWEGLIPVWGSGKQACEDFEAGHWGWGTFNTALAISDVVPVRAAGGAVAKGAWKCGSHSWKATSKWLTKCGWREFKGQEMHHWAIPQKGCGSKVPEWFKDQPWNLMPMPNAVFHDALHGVGEAPFNFGERLWYGTPAWFKAGGFSVGGREVNWLGNDGGSSFVPPMSSPVLSRGRAAGSPALPYPQ